MSEQERTVSAPQPIDLFALLHDFLVVLRRCFWTIPAVALVFGLLFGLRSYRAYSPRYQAQAVLSAQYNYGAAASTDLLSYGSYYTSGTVAKQIINTFPAVISTDAMRTLMLQELGAASINGTITPERIADSNLFTLTVTSPDPQDAYDILMAVIHNYPEVASLAVGNAKIEIIDPPVIPQAPMNGPTWRSAALKGGLLGAALMLVLLLAYSYLKRPVASPEEIRQFSSMTCLGRVPMLKQKKRASSTRTGGLSIQNKSLDPAYQEAIRTVRTRLLHRLPGTGCKVVLVTSTLPGEGKSTVSANLALSLAHTGKRVILVDADLRVQTLYDFFGLKGQSVGPAEVLRGSADPIASLQAVEGTSLRLLSGSKQVSAPASLLHAHRIDAMLKALAQEADYLVIDTPPIGLLSDAAAFLPFADGAVYVIREGAATRGQIVNSLQAFAGDNKLIGYVFNCNSQATGQYGYGHRYGYGYDSGYGKHAYGSGYGGYGAYSAYGKAAEGSPAESGAAASRTTHSRQSKR